MKQSFVKLILLLHTEASCCKTGIVHVVEKLHLSLELCQLVGLLLAHLLLLQLVVLKLQLLSVHVARFHRRLHLVNLVRLH